MRISNYFISSWVRKNYKTSRAFSFQSTISPVESQKILKIITEKSLPQWDSMNGLMAQSMHIEKAIGCYIYQASTGKKYFDMISGMFCCSAGHSRADIAEAVNMQLKTLAFSESRYAVVSVRAEVCNQLDEIMKEVTGEEYKFFFCNGGSDANEAALRIARVLTGRPKIVARNRSYHGASLSSLSVSGDVRRSVLETPGAFTMPNIVRVAHAVPKLFNWESVQQCLNYYEDCIEAEFPNTIAGFIMEGVTSTSNGLIAPPPGYLSGIQALCRKHGIITIVDEILTGLGRTAKWFGFQHNNCRKENCDCSDQTKCKYYERFVPDIVTMAKNISNGAIPLGVVAVNRKLADRFLTESIGIGATYNAHPVALAAAHATLNAYKAENLVERCAREISPQIEKFFERISAKNPRIVIKPLSKQVGALAILAVDMSQLKTPTKSTSDLRNKLLENGVYTLVLKARDPNYSATLANVVFSPPFVATKEELEGAFQGIERAILN